MIRILILASIGAVVSATPFFSDYPSGLESLFARKREAIGEIKDESTVCENKECKLIAQIIIDGMDESADPCDDFYQYACGNWIKKNRAPENVTVWNVNTQLEKMVEKEVAAIVRSPIQPNDLFAVKLAKKWFKSCKNEGAEENQGLETLVATLWRHGGWPLIMEKGEWDDRMYNWQIVDDHFARLTGANTFFDVFSAQLTEDSFSTLMLNTPHLPYGIYKLLSEPYHGTDTSDENNKSGEGSQEYGSKEKIPKNGEDEEDNEEDEGIEEDNEPEDAEDEESQAKRISRGRSHKRLGHHKRSSSKHSVGRKHHETHLRRRPKRDIIKEIAFHKLRSLKKHGVHQKTRKTGRKSSRHGHALSGSQKKSSTGKNDVKRTGKVHNANVKSANKKKYVVHKNNAKNDEENEEMKHSHHRVHHAARKMEDKEIDEAPNDNDNENEDNDSGNEVDTDGDDNNNEDDENADEEGNDDGEDNEEKEDDEKEDEKTKEELTEMYRKYMISVAETLSKVRGVDVSRDKLEKDVDDLIEFAIKVGESTLVDPEMENITLSEFQEWYDGLGSTTKNSKVNWEKKVLKLYTEAGLEYERDLNVTIPQPKYFEKIRAILDETPAEVVVNYIHWTFINQAGLLASLEIRKLIDDWEPTTYQDYEEECNPPKDLSEAIEYKYVQEHVPENLEKMVKDMIDDINKEIEYRIKESTWMDDDTKHFILDKLVYMQHRVGYPDWYKNSTLVQRYFQGLTIGTSFFENVMNYMRYRKWKLLRNTIMMDEIQPLLMSMLEVNAYFQPGQNLLALTAADLQNPYFGLYRPWHVNFGIMGATIGHEVNHGFDDQGHLFDREGKQTEWLSAMASAYGKRANCFVQQYNSYDIIKGDDFKIENYGNQTSGENIADALGLDVTFRAYLRRLRETKKPDPALAGLEKFDNNQTFFLAFASSWCDARDPATLKDLYKIDVHSPSRLRVIGTLANINGFAESFNCPAGSPMNPENKCDIWL